MDESNGGSAKRKVSTRDFGKIIAATILTAALAPLLLALALLVPWSGPSGSPSISLFFFIAVGLLGSVIALPAAIVNAIVVELTAKYWTMEPTAASVSGGACGLTLALFFVFDKAKKPEPAPLGLVFWFVVVGALMGLLYWYISGLASDWQKTRPVAPNPQRRP